MVQIAAIRPSPLPTPIPAVRPARKVVWIAEARPLGGWDRISLNRRWNPRELPDPPGASARQDVRVF